MHADAPLCSRSTKRDKTPKSSRWRTGRSRRCILTMMVHLSTFWCLPQSKETDAGGALFLLRCCCCAVAAVFNSLVAWRFSLDRSGRPRFLFLVGSVLVGWCQRPQLLRVPTSHRWTYCIIEELAPSGWDFPVWGFPLPRSACSLGVAGARWQGFVKHWAAMYSAKHRQS